MSGNTMILILFVVSSLQAGIMLNLLSKPKYGWYSAGIIGAGHVMVFFVYLFLSGSTLMGPPEPLRLFLTWGMFCTMAVFMYCGSALQKIFYAVIVVVLQVCADFITSFLNLVVFQFTSIAKSSTVPSEFIKMQCTFTVVFTIMTVIAVIIVKRRTQKLSGEDLKLFILFPLSQAAIAFFYIPLLKTGNESIFFTVAMIICISVAADVGMYKAIQKLGQKRIAEEQVHFLEKQLELQVSHYESYSEMEDKLRYLRHDVGNQLQVIKTLIEQKSYAEAEELSGGLEKYLAEIKSISFCGNKVINALLSSKYNEAQKQCVELNVDVRLGEELTVDKMDLCNVYSNITDNAICAVAKLLEAQTSCDAESKQITLETKKSGEYLVITCQNHYSGELLKDKDGKIVSQKGQGHGNGLAIVEGIAEKYNGYVMTHYDEKEFEIKVFLKLNQ